MSLSEADAAGASAGPSPAEALEFFRGHRVGDLVFDEHVRPVRFVTDPASGRVAMPVMVAMLSAGQQVLCLPRDSDDAMRLILTPEEASEPGPFGAIADRWRIYHGAPEDVRWASCWIEFAKWRGAVYDGDLFGSPSPIAGAESSLCKLLNADRARLASLCNEIAGVDPIVSDAVPVCVGIDAGGVDVRSRFGTLRLPFEAPVQTPQAARAAIDAWVACP